MPYETVYRDQAGRLKFPLVDLALLFSKNHYHLSSRERSAIMNISQLPASVMILAERLHGHLKYYEENDWSEVPFDELFLDTQSVVLFFRQFMEDTGIIICTCLPPKLGKQMPHSFTDLAERIRNPSKKNDAELAAILPPTDPLRKFLTAEKIWLSEVKDLRDDISHRTASKRKRETTFPSPIDLFQAGGGKAPFASAPDLRTYLRGLFPRWLALDCLTVEFANRRIQGDRLAQHSPLGKAFIVGDGGLEALEYFLE